MIPGELFASLSPYIIIMKRDEIYCNCDRHSVEPVTLRNMFAEYEQM